MTTRTVVYARANNGDQDQLTRQLEFCREYASCQGWQIVAEFVDQAVSGMSSKAPQLEQALTMAQSGEFHVLIVQQEDRLSCDLPKLRALLEEFNQAGVQIRCAVQRTE